MVSRTTRTVGQYRAVHHDEDVVGAAAHIEFEAIGPERRTSRKRLLAVLGVVARSSSMAEDLHQPLG
ncbi:MAG: hypothetical protein R2710_15995 [Acidimicrobiales bacterium]